MSSSDIPSGYLPKIGLQCHIHLMNMEAIRKSRGLTQEDLAGLAGVRQPTIARIENGSDSVTLRTLKEIARALEVTLADLFDEGRAAPETLLVQFFRSLPPERQAGWLDLARLGLPAPSPGSDTVAGDSSI